jgi:hypothetical protein
MRTLELWGKGCFEMEEHEKALAASYLGSRQLYNSRLGKASSCLFSLHIREHTPFYPRGPHILGIHLCYASVRLHFRLYRLLARTSESLKVSDRILLSQISAGSNSLNRRLSSSSVALFVCLNLQPDDSLMVHMKDRRSASIGWLDIYIDRSSSTHPIHFRYI